MHVPRAIHRKRLREGPGMWLWCHHGLIQIKNRHPKSNFKNFQIRKRLELPKWQNITADSVQTHVHIVFFPFSLLDCFVQDFAVFIKMIPWFQYDMSRQICPSFVMFEKKNMSVSEPHVNCCKALLACVQQVFVENRRWSVKK